MKKLISTMLALSLGLSLAACTSSTTPDDTATDNPPPAEDQITINYWSMWNESEPQGKVLSDAAKKYNEENPNVNVEITWQGRDITKVIGTKLNAGESIDMWDGPTNTILIDTAAYALDVTDLMSQEYPTTGGKPYKDVVLNATVETTKTYSNDGEINGIPYQPYVQCFFYNKDHFAAAGITETPKTWDEFLDACEKLKAAGYAPITSDDAYMTALPGYYLARAKSGEWVSQLVTENNDEMWKDPVVLEMAQQFYDMGQKGYFHENTVSNIFPAGQQDMANDQVSMYLNGSWLINELMPVTGPDFPWGQMHFPAVPNGEGSPTATNYAGQIFVINKNGENQEEAFKFATYLTTGEWDAILAESTYGVPSGVDSVWPVQLEDAKEVFVTTDEWLPWSGGMDDNVDLSAAIRAAFTELIGGSITPEQFVERMVNA